MSLAKFPLLLSFDGRINRLTFVGYKLAAIAVGTLAYHGKVELAETRSLIALPFFLVLGLVFMAAVWSSFSLSARRLHDLDCSGWLNLQIAIAVFVIMLIEQTQFWSVVVTVVFEGWLLFGPGSAEANKYGSPPARGFQTAPDEPLTATAE